MPIFNNKKLLFFENKLTYVSFENLVPNIQIKTRFKFFA